MEGFSKQKVMVVDDEENIVDLLTMYLVKEGYEVQSTNNGLEAISLFKDFQPDLTLLDIMLPDADGLRVCREIRKTSDAPVIMISAKGETFDRVLGLELGADDYITKPFDPKEVMARIKAVLRRSVTKEESKDEISYPGLTINKTTYNVTVDGEEIPMPPKELELLYFLASNPNKVYSRDQLLEFIWGYGFFGDSRTIDVHVKRLREKVEKQNHLWQIKTVWGVGYKFEIK